MKFTRLIVGIAAASSLGLLFAGAPIVAAQDGREEITISPATTTIQADPGQELSGSFKVINTGETDLEFTVYARPYSVETEAYNPNYSAVSERSSVYKWVQFDTTEGRLTPGTEQQIAYTVRIPANASPGGHYSVLFAETVPAEGGDQMVVRNKRVGSVVRLTVDGERNESGQTSWIKLPWLQLHAPLTASTRVTNEGNVDVDAATTLTVRSLFGRELYSEQQTNAVFPSQPRMIEREWEDAPVFGVYRASFTTTVLGEDTTVNRYVVMMPVPVMVIIIIGVLAGVLYAGYRRLR